MSGCTVFVFCSLMEYALVNILMGDIIDGEESALKKGMKSMFVTSGASSGSGRMPASSQQVRAAFTFSLSLFLLRSTGPTLTFVCHSRGVSHSFPTPRHLLYSAGSCIFNAKPAVRAALDNWFH